MPLASRAGRIVPNLELSSQLLSKRLQGLTQFFRHRKRFEVFAIGRNEHEMRRRHQVLFDCPILSLSSYFKIQTERGAPDLTDMHTDFQQIIHPRGAMKVAFEVHARQPDIKFIEYLSIRHTDRAKQFRLGDFKEANVRAVKDDVGGINVAPTDALFNGELMGLIHRLIVSLIQLFDEL